MVQHIENHTIYTKLSKVGDENVVSAVDEELNSGQSTEVGAALKMAGEISGISEGVEEVVDELAVDEESTVVMIGSDCWNISAKEVVVVDEEVKRADFSESPTCVT